LLPLDEDGLFIATELSREREELVLFELDALADGVGWLSAFAAIPVLAPVPALLAVAP
jgi:hypothetical protein